MKTQEKTELTQAEYNKLVIYGVKYLRQVAKESHETLSLEEAIRQAREQVSEFYTKA